MLPAELLMPSQKMDGSQYLHNFSSHRVNDRNLIQNPFYETKIKANNRKFS